MCGFALISDPNNTVQNQQVFDLLRRRGPDNSGYTSVNKLNFYHTRLSIRDVSSAGSQPMVKDDVYLCYNGELYNEDALATAIGKDRSNNGTSDTELLLDYYLEHGIEKTLTDLNGMYAFTIADFSKKIIYVVSDRFGEKPIYFSQNLKGSIPIKNENFCISSEIMVVSRCLPDGVTLNSSAVQEFLEFGYISAPFTIYNEVSKIEPGVVLQLNLDNDGQIIDVTQTKYFEAKLAQLEVRTAETYWDFKKNVSGLLNSSVKGAMSSDLPVCTMLSGGIDSSLVTHFASLNQKVVSFTLGFSRKGFDESDAAKFVADKLGIENRNVLFDPEELEVLIDKSIAAYSEPFADSSQIAAMLMSSKIAKDFKVCLTGDGADEIFLGYHRHIFAPKLWQLKNYTPNFALRLATSERLKAKTATLVEKFVGRIGMLDVRTHRIGYKINKAVNALDSNSFSEMYLRLHSSQTVLDTREKNYQHKLTNVSCQARDLKSLSQNIRELDLKSYLPGDILVKTDRASMYYGLEARAPFLNHELLKYVNNTPLDYLIHKGKGKRVLRDLAGEIFGSSFANLPKKGFSVPIQEYVIEYQNFDELIDYFSENKHLNEYAPYIEDLQKSTFSKEANFEFLWRIIILYKWSQIYL